MCTYRADRKDRTASLYMTTYVMEGNRTFIQRGLTAYEVPVRNLNISVVM